MDKQIPANVDAYIAGCPEEARPFLTQLRQVIAQAAPEATEKISWGMATFVYHGNLVHFSGEKQHAGFHPAPSAIDAFRDELEGYVCSKGTVRLPYRRPLPTALIQKMVRFRVAEQAALHAHKLAGGTPPAAAPRPRHPMPEEVAAALAREGLEDAYKARPPYQRNDYLGWIGQAKRAETREKRLQQMLDELRAGDAYMGMDYGGRRD